MNKKSTIWLIIGLSLILLGFIIFVVAMTANGWNFGNLTTSEFETNTHEITEDFSDIEFDVDTADIVFSPSENGECKIVCYENVKMKHSVTVQDGKLTVESVDEREWYEHIGINFTKDKITVYLPKTAYDSLEIEGDTSDVEIAQNFHFESMEISLSTGNVKNFASVTNALEITTSTGNIEVNNVSASELTLSVSTGAVSVSNTAIVGDISVNVSTGRAELDTVSCTKLTSNGDTGDIVLKNVVALQSFSIEGTPGTVTFDKSDAVDIFVKTSTGRVTGTLLSEKVFVANASTGYVDVPKDGIGGRCEITTTTGDIRISIA